MTSQAGQKHLHLSRESVTVRVPATCANLGPGFDCIGMALDIWNELTVSVSEKQGFEIEGEGRGTIPCDNSNFILVGMKAAFKVGLTLRAEERRKQSIEREESVGVLSPSTAATEQKREEVCTDSFVAHACDAIRRGEHLPVKLPPFHYKCINRVPFALGLGSSSAAIVSGLIAGLLLLGVELPVTNEEALLNLACAIEGHPDNVAPAIYGCLQLGIRVSLGQQHEGTDSPFSTEEPVLGLEVESFSGIDANKIGPGYEKWLSSPVPLPNGLQCILFLPDLKTGACERKTEKARQLLPKHVPQTDAVFNVSRAALLVNAFASGNLSMLRVAMDDKLHQPFRGAQHTGPHVFPIIQAAIHAGAHGACLSGAGPAVLAFSSGAKGDIYTQRRGERAETAVAKAMLAAAGAMNVKGKIFITIPTTQGAHVVSLTPPLSDGAVCRFAGGGFI